MKLQTIMALFAVSLAVLASGCRYNKAKSGAAGTDDGLANGGTSEIESNVDETAIQSGSIDDLTKKSFKDRGYALCSDVNFEPVYFAFDATAIKPDELGKIEAVAKHLADNPDRVVTIEGNCDERGSNEYNVTLGEDRAIMVANFLGQNGISADRYETVSRGETNPAVAGSGEEAWSKNRRGEFIIWKK